MTTLRLRLALFLPILIVALVDGAAGSESAPASWYSCSPTTCHPPSCRCASDASPRPTSRTPQFILLSNDDSVDSQVTAAMLKLVRTPPQSNGCPIPVTWFVRSELSSCNYIFDLFSRGDEMAAHTVTHRPLTPAVGQSTLVHEVRGSRDYLVQKCGLPAGAVVGYRSPYRITNPRLRATIQSLGFLYDSTLTFQYSNMSTRTWPFTEDHGLPDPSCPNCMPGERYSGVWQVPVYALSYDGQVYKQDPGMGKNTARARAQSRSVYDVLMSVFNATYYHDEDEGGFGGGGGNRAPITVAVHDYWLNDAQRVKDAQRFIRDVVALPDVYFVTYRQLVEWMRGPVMTDKVGEWLKERCGAKELR